MKPEVDGILYRSRPYTFALGQTIAVDTNFLQPVLAWEAPEICEIILVLYGSVTATGGGAALGRDFAKLFSNVQIMSKQEHVNASGASLRVNEQFEYGSRQADPGDVSTSGTNASYEGFVSIPFEFTRDPADNRRDPHISAKAFLGCGGKFNTRFAAAYPTNWSTTTLTYELWVRVKEARQKQVNSLYTLQEYSLTIAEDQIPIGGSLRQLSLTSALATTGYTSMATVVAIDSKSLNYESGLPPRMLRDRYRRQHYAVGANDEFLLATPGAIPWIVADNAQKIGSMPMLTTCHVKLNVAVPASSVFLVGSYQDRHPLYGALSAGFNDPGEYLAAVNQWGYVRDKNNTPAKGFDPYLVCKLPIRIMPGGPRGPHGKRA